jgi:phosphate acetyltransferase
MTDIIKEIRNRATKLGKTVVLPETDDPRVLKAASFLDDQKICSVILIGKEDRITKLANKERISLPNSVDIMFPETSSFADELANNLYERRKHKGISTAEADEALRNPLYFGAGLVATGKADGCVAGSVATTGEVIRAAIHSIGLRETTDIVSSTFLMALKEGRVLTYADCGVVPYPDAHQLADIAIESARTHELLTQEEPVVAMLSFSTKGSAKHERTELVTEALEIAHKKAPELQIDGEFQFDAAFVPEVAERKAPESNVAGKANVFIFPNLDAGNIGYKITERLAGATATGPILQGLAQPMMDLSRGCSWQDIVNAACVAILIGRE